MRIGVFSYDYDPPIGGIGTVAKRSVCELVRAHPDDTLFVFSPSSSAPPVLPRLTRWWWSRRGGCPVFSLTLHLLLDRIVQRYALDLIHVHAGSGGVFLLRKPAVPLIVTAHHTYEQEARLVYANQPVVSRRKRFMASLECRTYRCADRILCVSADTMQAIGRAYGIPADHMEVVENGVPQSQDFPRGVQRDGNTLLFIGRLEPRKGIWTLLSAFATLAGTYGNLKLMLVGENLLGSSLPRFLVEKGIAGRVQLLGRVGASQLAALRAGASIVVIPSVLEGFGLAAAESMAAGTCVVASDCPGLGSIIEDGRTGLLFRSGDSGDCARAIETALMRPGLRASIEREAKRCAAERFSPDSQAAKTYRAFERAAARAEGAVRAPSSSEHP